MRLSIADYDCRMEVKSPGYFVFYRNSGGKPVGELILKENGSIPEVGLVEIFDTSLKGIGFGQAMYNKVEDSEGIQIKASDNITYDAYRLWMNRDPDQVKNSLYAFRGQLLDKSVKHPHATGVITEVRNDSVSVKNGGMTLPLRKIHLKELGLIPLSDRELEVFLQESCITDNEGLPLKCFHGSMDKFDHFEDKPTYFTGNNGYQFIQKADYVHECYLSIKRPFWIETQSDIESLKTFPDKIEALRRLGYDGVVYADQSDLRKGTTGWGNDYSQFIVFDSSQIINADLYPDLHEELNKSRTASRAFDKNQVIHENGSPKTFFHGTSSFFREFRDTQDIGFHFGTKRAALERVGGHPTPEIDVELIEPTPTEILCAKIASGEAMAKSLVDQAYHLFMRKLQYPHADVYEVLKETTEDELQGLIDENIEKEDSDAFKRKAKNGLKQPKWVVTVDDEPVGEFIHQDTAEKYAQEVKRSFIKRVNLVLENPLRMEDLGVWCPFEIADRAGLSEDFISENLDGRVLSEDRYRIVKEELKRQGYDGIVYENKAEDKGSDSYIVFDSNQIIQIDPIEPDFRFEAPRNSDLSLEVK